MNTVSITNYKSTQKLHPLSLLAQLASRKTSGCLRVSNGSVSWFIYLEQGELVYASNTNAPFERLDRHLRQISRTAPTIVSAVRVQVRLLFEAAQTSQFNFTSDYQAINWLVEQQYLTLDLATTLIEGLAKEVLEPFLLVREGSYELIEKEKFTNWQMFCQLDLRSLVEYCQQQLQQNQAKRGLPPLYKPGSEPATTPKVTEAINKTELLNKAIEASQEAVKPAPQPAQPAPSAQPTAIKPEAKVGNQKPTTTPNVSPANANANAKAKGTTETLSKTTYTVVCIDDSPTVLQAIHSFLDDVSFSVVMINDPVKALMQVVRSKPDLILLDVGMPNLDGYELCSLLRRHPSFKATPIIMVTGNTGFIDRAKAKLVGASGYLTKPFTQSELLKIVFKHLT
jgi:two-component system, chemotaxis family, response regulator PixG